METITSTTPRVYVACLAAYNNGILHGAWCDATDADGLREAIADVVKTSPEPFAEEWAIHDYDNFGNLAQSLGEWPDLDELCKLGSWLEEADDPDAVITFLGHDNFDNIAAAKQAFDDSYRGKMDLEDYARDLLNECYDIPKFLVNYIDYKALSRDMGYDGYWEDNGYVFGPY